MSLVLPAYNEAGSVVPLISEIIANAPGDAEVILVDDDSPDGTARVAQEAFAHEPRVRVIVRTSDRGFARSILEGIRSSRGTWVIVMDSDFNHDPSVIPALIGISPYAGIVSGSRFAPGGDMDDRVRYVLSFIYNLGVRLLLRTQVQDNLCGYFIMRRSELVALPLDEIFFGFGDYFFRLVYFAQRRSVRIIEVPIVISARRTGKAKNRFVPTFAQYTRELLAFRWKTLRRRPPVLPR
ncbi:MAG: glycosyltransferase [Elusimicrobia bacterium]|nr:glycosyltransferase [Elusimicrobiota bacterium]